MEIELMHNYQLNKACNNKSNQANNTKLATTKKLIS